MTGNTLKAIRVREGLTQAQLGAKLGCNRDTIRRYEVRGDEELPAMISLAVERLLG